MKFFSKRTAAALFGAMFLMSAVSCNDKSSTSDAADQIGSLAQEDMPYGATITQLKPSLNENVKIAIEYDNRYLSADETTKLSDYVAALNSCDSELMANTFYNPYLDKVVEQSGAADLNEYITDVHNNIRDNYIGYDYNFNYIVIEDCLTEDDDDSETGFSSVDNTIDNLGDEKITDKVTSRKFVTFDIQYTLVDGEDAYMLSTSTGTSSSLYIYTIDGEIYII